MEQNNNSLNSISLAAFKAMNGIDTITVLKGEGRRFADTVVGRIYFSDSADLKKPLFVAKGKYEAYWVFNQNVQEVGEL